MTRRRTLLLAVAAIALATLGTATRDAATRPAAAAIAAPPLPLHTDSLADARHWASVPTAAATPNPGAWCGTFGAADDLADEVAPGAPKFHVVIAVPSDVAAEPVYQAYGRQALADDAFRTVKAVETFHLGRTGAGAPGQTAYGWSLRFDYGTSCGAQFPDISVYHLPRTQAQYGFTDPYAAIAGDLSASGLYSRGDKRYLVHYVGRHDTACGQSYIYDPNDAGGGARYSIIYNFLPVTSRAGGVLPAAECPWTTDAHELGHSIGAATGGPRNNDGAHVWDCYNDIMSYAAVTAVCGDGDMYFDYGHDNYLSHGGAWYDTRNSAYWCKPGPC
jgi:hypothetical protein